MTAIPVTAFYEGDAPSHFARFAFCKRPEVLTEALERLATLFAQHRDAGVEILTPATRSA